MKSGVILRYFKDKRGREIIFRTPKLEDLDDLTTFINSLVEEGADITMNEKVTREEEAKWLERQLVALEKNERLMIVAEAEGRVVGNAALFFRKGYSSHVADIGIGILKDYRDVGIGTEMLKTLIDKAREKGLKILLIDVFETNKRARHVYLKLGFKETGRRPKSIYKNDKYMDDILMTMELD